MSNFFKKEERNRGAIALITVILLTSFILIVGVGLAIMNLDYTLTIGASLSDRSLLTATDGCLDSAISQIQADSSFGSTNIANIGTANLNCNVSISSSGNERYLLARTTSTTSFINTVRNASTTVDVSTNPITVSRYQEDVDAVSNVLSNGGNINVSSSSGLYASVAVDSGFAYISYRDGSSANKLTVTKVNLATFATVSSIQNISTTAATYEDSVILNGYLYVNYRKYTGVNGSSEKLSIAQINLNNFASGGVTLREDLTSGCPTASCIGTQDSLAVYGNTLYLAYQNEVAGKLELMKIDVSNFASGSFSTLTALSTGAPTSIDMITYNGYAFIAFEDYGAGAPKLAKINLATFAVTSTLNMDPLLAATYTRFTIIDNLGYFAWDEYNNTRNVSIAKINIIPDTMVKLSTLRTSSYSSHMGMDNAGGFIYIQTNNSANSVITMLKIDVRLFSSTGISTLTGYHSGDLYEDPGLVAPGGAYVYVADHNRTAARPRLIKIKVD